MILKKEVQTNKRQKKIKINKIQIDFLEWFIGFTEGDGSFFLNNNKPNFTINQADLQVLLLIRKNLGFGNVYTFKQNNRTYARYSVTKMKDIKKLIALFNGNIQLEKVFLRFKDWVNCYNCYNNNEQFTTFDHSDILIKPKRSLNQINLNNSWFAGFYDAEGGFYAQIGFRVEPKSLMQYPRLRLKAYLDQKNEKDLLLVFCQLFKKEMITVRNENKKLYRMDLTSKKSLELLVNYFSNYKLRTKKHIVYAMWKKFVNLYTTSKHLVALQPKNIISFKKRIAKIKYQNGDFKRINIYKTVIQK